MPTAHAGIITDAPSFAEIGLNVLSTLLGVFGTVAVISIVVVGIVLLLSVGNDKIVEIGKRAFLYSVIGIVVALLAIVIVKTIGEVL